MGAVPSLLAGQKEGSLRTLNREDRPQQKEGESGQGPRKEGDVLPFSFSRASLVSGDLSDVSSGARGFPVMDTKCRWSDADASREPGGTAGTPGGGKGL